MTQAVYIWQRQLPCETIGMADSLDCPRLPVPYHNWLLVPSGADWVCMANNHGHRLSSAHSHALAKPRLDHTVWSWDSTLGFAVLYQLGKLFTCLFEEFMPKFIIQKALQVDMDLSTIDENPGTGLAGTSSAYIAPQTTVWGKPIPCVNTSRGSSSRSNLTLRLTGVVTGQRSSRCYEL